MTKNYDVFKFSRYLNWSFGFQNVTDVSMTIECVIVCVLYMQMCKELCFKVSHLLVLVHSIHVSDV